MHPQFAAHQPKVIAVLPMDNFSLEPELETFLYDSVYEQLQTKGYRRIAVDKVKTVMDDLGIQTAGQLQGISLQRLSEALNADAVFKGQVDQLEKVQAFLEKNLEQAGIAAATRSFSPHFTLGRLKDRGAALGKCIQQFESYGSKSCLIKSMKLFKSDLMTKGAVHTVLFEAGFGKMGQGLNLFAAQKDKG